MNMNIENPRALFSIIAICAISSALILTVDLYLGAFPGDENVTVSTSTTHSGDTVEPTTSETVNSAEPATSETMN